MKRIRVFGLTIALAAGWGGPALAAEPPPERTTLMAKLFGPSKPKQSGPTVRDPQRPLTISMPLPPDQLAEALRAEQEAYLRRVSVCTELRRIAVERGDDAMAHQADELERQVGALYNARVAALGVARTKAPLPEPSIASRGPVDGPTLLSESASAKIAARQLEAPPAPVPGTTTAQVREVKP
jgi:hypothetical protein